MSDFRIQTAQNVSLSQNLASIGDRIVAVLLDWFFLFLFYILLMVILDSLDFMDNMEVYSFVLVLTLPYFLYFPLLQYWNNGQTLGKKAVKIRVVKTDNSHPRLVDFLVRWLLRIIEVDIFGALGILVTFLNGKKQRIGDSIANTVVVSERKKTKISHTVFEVVEEGYQPTYSEAQFLTDKDVHIIKEVFNDAKRKRNKSILVKLTNRIFEVTGIDKPKKMKHVKFITTLLKDYNYYANL